MAFAFRAAVLLVCLLVWIPCVAETIKYTPTGGVQTFAVRDPILRLKPGDILESQTFSQPGDYYEREGGPWPGEVGPFFIEGARPGDTLVQLSEDGPPSRLAMAA